MHDLLLIPHNSKESYGVPGGGTSVHQLVAEKNIVIPDFLLKMIIPVFLSEKTCQLNIMRRRKAQAVPAGQAL